MPGLPRDNVPKKPKGKVTAFNFYRKACREELRKRKPDETVRYTVFYKLCAQRWRTMSPNERVPFKNQAKVDSDRFNAEMRKFAPAEASKESKKDKKKKKKLTRDPTAPKRPLTGFFWFSSDERPKVRAEFPDYNVVEVSKILGRRWSEIDTQTKDRYNMMAKRDQERYRRELETYLNKPGTSVAMASVSQPGGEETKKTEEMKRGDTEETERKPEELKCDLMEESKAGNMVENNADELEETQADGIEETQADGIEETQADGIEETQADEMEENEAEERESEYDEFDEDKEKEEGIRREGIEIEADVDKTEGKLDV